MRESRLGDEEQGQGERGEGQRGKLSVYKISALFYISLILLLENNLHLHGPHHVQVISVSLGEGAVGGSGNVLETVQLGYFA